MGFISMAMLLLIISVSLLSWPFQVSSSPVPILSKGSSLSVEKPQVVTVSPNGMFSAGFHAVGVNAYCFAIWFTQTPGQKQNPTLVWMANRDQPVNGKRSTLSLVDSGNLILTDAGQFSVWATNTSSPSSVELHLDDTGNLVLKEIKLGGVILWQSFDFPTNTLLPHQHFTRHTSLVSSRSESNHSSGFYKLFFNNDNVIRLLYDNAEVSSSYWPDPWLMPSQSGRSTYNASRIAVLDSLGNFTSSDNFGFTTSDHGTVLQRRLVVDYDGNLRVYSRKDGTEKWYVSWQAQMNPCRIHGVCGSNSICTVDPGSGSKCSCLPGYRLKNDRDLSQGCEPKYKFSCTTSESYIFLQLPHVDFYGYDIGSFLNFTFEQCSKKCLESCYCIGFQYHFTRGDGFFNCYPKTFLLNGCHSPAFEGDLYLKLPKGNSSSYESFFEESNTHCSKEAIEIERMYVKGHENGKVKLMLWFATGIGGLEMICILLVWGFLIRSRQQSDKYTQGYLPLGTGFRNYSFSELKKATQGFSQEIGRGAGGIVYKGELPDQGVVAIKRLNEAVQGEEEFLDELSIIGRLNHMNLIKMWGYCAEGKHRLLVYEYMENGSLAENLVSNTLDFNTRFNIALGMARGLAYLHEECLEWILHCDVKPQNILLDSSYEPKVADFGLSKLLNRNDFDNTNFSRIRGTRGYMAPEWVFNLPITSKVDVYSYGIVVLEMVTGKSPMMGIQNIDGEVGNWRLVTWVRGEKTRGSVNASWLKQIIDPMIEGDFDFYKMQVLVEVALQCVEDKDARPTMKQVVEMLQTHEND